MALVPTFGHIVDVLVFDVDNFYIAYQLLETKCYSHHYHAYEVSYPPEKEYAISKASNFIDNPLLGIYKEQSTFYISLKYHIIENV